MKKLFTLAALILTTACGQATDPSSEVSLPEGGAEYCPVIEAGVAAEGVEGEFYCYTVPEEPTLVYSHFQAVGCEIQNNGVDVHDFTVWNEVEPGEIHVWGCDFNLLLSVVPEWRDDPNPPLGTIEEPEEPEECFEEAFNACNNDLDTYFECIDGLSAFEPDSCLLVAADFNCYRVERESKKHCEDEHPTCEPQFSDTTCELGCFERSDGCFNSDTCFDCTADLSDCLNVCAFNE